jgi:hypothetical protein
VREEGLRNSSAWDTHNTDTWTELISKRLMIFLTFNAAACPHSVSVLQARIVAWMRKAEQRLGME